MFLAKRPRIAVVNLLVGVDADSGGPLRDIVREATKRIVDADGAFDVAKDELERVVRALLAHDSAWSHAACGGEVFDDEASADQYGSESFVDLSSRYSSGANDEDTSNASPKDEVAPHVERFVVMLTIAYKGESLALERAIGEHDVLADALKAILALIAADRVELAHVHVAPALPGDHLDDERMLVGFPELMQL